MRQPANPWACPVLGRCRRRSADKELFSGLQKKNARAAVYQSTQRKARLDEASLVKILDTNGGRLCTDLFQAVAPNSADLIDPGVSCLKRQTKSTIVPQSRAATYTSQICYLAKLHFLPSRAGLQLARVVPRALGCEARDPLLSILR